MRSRLLYLSLSCVIAAFAAALLLEPGCLTAQPKPTKGVWTSADDSTLPADFKIQGEYVGTSEGKVGCQVIALGEGQFQAVLFAGGLPGDGWDGKNRSLMSGKLEGEKAVFTPAVGSRKYLAQKPDEFSATSKFPPEGHKPYHAEVVKDTMTVKGGESKPVELKRVARVSPTMGAKPPSGAVVLFDGTNTDEWKGGRLDKMTKWLNTDGSDIATKRKFSDYTVHCEFMMPYRPDARGQGRGNSGFYQVHQYEVQVLDSFGLEGKDNECGGIYSKLASKVNGCLPPLQWQTYDIDFTNAVRERGKKEKNARVTVRLNGIVVQDNVEISGPTGGARNEPEGTPGPFILQGHGNPLQYRNIWVVEKQSK